MTTKHDDDRHGQSIHSYWDAVSDGNLAQGDYLSECPIPDFPNDFKSGNEFEVQIRDSNVIVMSQSCDIAQRKIELVALCPVFTLDEFCKCRPGTDYGFLNKLKRGEVHYAHMLSGFDSINNKEAVMIVDFREIYSLPVGYLISHASNMTVRWRLRSPFLEHFSQAFARFFMRVGLPSAIPEFDKSDTHIIKKSAIN